MGSILKEAYLNPPKNKKDLGIKDYALYYEPKLRLSKLKSLAFVHPPKLLTPFKGWVNKKTKTHSDLSWWKSYNQIKHHRIEQYQLSTLHNTLMIVCGLQQVISMLPIFTRALWRHNLITSHNYVHFTGQKIENTTVRDFAIVETKLFATAIGHEKFPNKIEQISPIEYRSERLAKHLGNW